MRKGLVISLAIHGAILFWAIAVFPTARDLAQPDQPIAVEVVPVTDKSQVKAGKKDAKKKKAETAQKPKPKTKKPAKVAKKEEPVRPKRVKAPAPKPKPKTAAEPAPRKVAKKPEPKPELVRKAKAPSGPAMPSRKPASAPKFTEELRPKPKRKVAQAKKPKKKAFDANKISALLDKRPDAGPKPQPVSEPTKPAQGLAQGRDQQMTLSEIDALRARISQCWSPPVGGLGADAIKVKLRLQLGSDGMLVNQPQVMNRQGSPFFQAAADSAVRAVMLCQPYQLPATKFALWKDMILNFDPREMFGG